jgi:hypothetical protein
VMFKRPYNVTFAVCACAASGADSTPATARATSFLFIEVSPLSEKSAGTQHFPAIGTFSGLSRSWSHCAKRPQIVGSAAPRRARCLCGLLCRSNKKLGRRGAPLSSRAKMLGVIV